MVTCVCRFNHCIKQHTLECLSNVCFLSLCVVLVSLLSFVSVRDNFTQAEHLICHAREIHSRAVMVKL